MTESMVYVFISGGGIYETLPMPTVPRKGDILWLSSLTLGACPVLEVVVSKVEWSRDQTAAYGENNGIHARLTVRRTSRAVEYEKKQRIDKALGR
jgi:hypothetical protein